MSNRRSFLKTTAFATAGLAAMPTLLKGSSISANERISVGLIGCRGQGWSNLQSFLKQPDVVCAALCDIDRNILEERASQVEKLTGSKPALYGDFRKLLDRKDIDAVIVATPDHWHCIQMVNACETGKDVFCEKPLANTIEECNIMVSATKRYGRVVQVGQWQRSDPHWKDAVEYLHNGTLGQVRSVRAWSYVGWKGSIPHVADSQVPEGVDYDMWLGPAPKRPFNMNRFHFTFRWYWDYAGGLMTDWGVHLLDYALFGMNRYVPESVMATGGKYAYPDDAMETPDTLMAMYDFGDFGLLWDHTIGIYGSNYGRGHGVAFIGEYGTLVVDRSGWEVLPETNSVSAKQDFVTLPLQKSTGKGLDLHVRNFLDCIKSREKPACDIEIAAHTARIAHLGNISYRLGRKVFWDHEQQHFTGDPKANELVKARYRDPWKLPEV